MHMKNEANLSLSEIEIKRIIASYIMGNYNLGVKIEPDNITIVKNTLEVEARVHGYFNEMLTIREE